MPKFLPAPVYPETWWKSRTGANPLGVPFDEEFKEQFCPDCFIAWAVYRDEPYAPPGGYPNVFPTATDCLLWLRWWLLPEECAQGTASDTERRVRRVEALTDHIESYPDGTRSDRVLAEVLDGVSLERLDLSKIESIHAFLSSSVTPEEMRFVFADPGITRRRGRWLLTDEQWRRLTRFWNENGEETTGGRIFLMMMLDLRGASTLDMAAWGGVKKGALVEALREGVLHGVQLDPIHFLSSRDRETRDDDWIVIEDEAFEAFIKEQKGSTG